MDQSKEVEKSTRRVHKCKLSSPRDIDETNLTHVIKEIRRLSKIAGTLSKELVGQLDGAILKEQLCVCCGEYREQQSVNACDEHTLCLDCFMNGPSHCKRCEHMMCTGCLLESEYCEECAQTMRELEEEEEREWEQAMEKEEEETI